MNTQLSFERTNRTLVLAAFTLGIGGHAVAAVGTASASGTVVAPIVITKTSDLSFGTFASGAGGNITISTSGVRSASGVVPSSDGATMTAATFVVSGDKGASYSITHGGNSSLTRKLGSETMSMTKFSDFTGANSTAGTATSGTLTGGMQSIYVGGTLNVSASQAAGEYTGQIIVTVEYN